jgi:hypothetical protein
MIVVKCSCGKSLSVDEVDARSPLKCPWCGNPFRIATDGPAVFRVPAGTRTAAPAAVVDTSLRPQAAPWVEERFERLEAENRLLRRTLQGHRIHSGLVAACLLSAVGFLLFTGGPASAHKVPPPYQLPRVIEAEGFVVKDSLGNVRAALGRTPVADSPDGETWGLDLYSGGTRRGSFSAVDVPNDPDGRTRLLIADAKGTPRVMAGLSSRVAGFSLFAPDGRLRSGLATTGDGTVALHLLTTTGVDKFQFGVQGSDDKAFYKAPLFGLGGVE